MSIDGEGRSINKCNISAPQPIDIISWNFVNQLFDIRGQIISQKD